MRVIAADNLAQILLGELDNATYLQSCQGVDFGCAQQMAKM